MAQYLLRRLVSLLPVLFGISIVVFLLQNVIPGDPVSLIVGNRRDPEIIEMIRRELGLDKPLYKQYLIFVGKAVRGDLGRSYYENEKVSKIIAQRFKYTLALTLLSMIIAIGFGITAGLLSAWRPHSGVDYLFTFLAVLGISLPIFWVGLLLQLLFASRLGWLPVSGSGYSTNTLYNLPYIILPAITLSTVPMAIISRMTRSSTLEVMSLDYIRTAKAKGLSPSAVILRHALKNALIPIITVIGNNFALLLTGAVLTETVFSWPGLGRAMVDAIGRRDFPVVIGGVLFMAVIFILVNLVVDILYAFLNPRIRYTH